jgi:hypothetical protein
MPRLFFIAALFFSLTGNSVAQTSSPDSSPVLTLESALEQAQQNNRFIAISRQSVLFANDEILAARTQRYPHFNVQLRGSSLLTAVDNHIPRGVFGNVGNTPVPSTNSIITTEPKFSALNLIQVVQPLSQLYDAHLNIGLLQVCPYTPQSERRTHVIIHRSLKVSSMLRLPAVLLAVICLGCLASPSALGQAASDHKTSDVMREMSNSFQNLVKRVSPSVVEVLVTGFGAPSDEDDKGSSAIGRERSLGSGFIIDSNGYIVTNYHVVRGSDRVRVLLTPERQKTRSPLHCSSRMAKFLPLAWSASASWSILLC